MEDYKEINKELVEQVQTMRIRLQEVCEEVVNLRADCMHKHEKIVLLTKKCKDFALLHLQEYLEFLEPGSDLLAILKDDLSTPAQCLENGNIRQSSRLTVEFRRSSCLTQTRRSFNSTSPTRLTSCVEAQLVEDDSLEFESSLVLLGNAILEDEREYEEEDKVVGEERESDTAGTRNCLDTTNSLCQGETDESGTESNIDLRAASDIDTVESRANTIRDITNTFCPTNTLHKKNSTEHKPRSDRGSSLNRNKTTNCSTSGHENEYTNIVSPTDSFQLGRNTNNLTLNRGRSEKKHLEKEKGREKAHKNLSDYQIRLEQLGNLEDSLFQYSNTHISRQELIHEVPQMRRGADENLESFSVPGEEVTDTEICLSQFKDASSSTPIQKLHNVPPSAKSSSKPGLSSRPKRSCSVKSMVEPSLGAKMRNDSAEKSLGYQSKFRRSHK